MNATMRFIVWGTIPVGSIVGGFLGGVIGLHETIWIGAIGGLFAFLPVLLSPVRGIRDMPAPIEDDDDANPDEGGIVPPGRSPDVSPDDA